MDQKTEIRSYIKCRIRLNIDSKQIFNELCSIYGPQTISMRIVFRWFKAFKAGKFSVEGDTRPGSPTTSVTKANIYCFPTDRYKAVPLLQVFIFLRLWFHMWCLLSPYLFFVLFLGASGGLCFVIVPFWALFVRLFDLHLFGFVCFLFLLVSGKGCGLWLWHFLDVSLTFVFHLYFDQIFHILYQSLKLQVLIAIIKFLKDGPLRAMNTLTKWKTAKESSFLGHTR